MRVIQRDPSDHRTSLAAFIRMMWDSAFWLERSYAIRYLEQGRYRLLRIVAAIPPSPHGLHILDIGTTPFTFYLRTQFPQHRLASVDLTPLWAAYCQDQRIEFQTCDLVEHELPYPPNTFDVVVFTEVLEHLDAPPAVILRKIHRVLKPGGHLIFSVPNLASLQNRVSLLMGHSPLTVWQESPLGVHGHGHLREYTRAEVCQLLTSSAFQIVSLTFLQPRVLDVFTRRDVTFVKKLVTAAYYFVNRFQSCRQIIFVESIRAHVNA